MSGELKVLTSRHHPALRALVDLDPIVNCVVAARLAEPMEPWALSGQLVGWFEDGRLASAMYSGANLIPIGTTPRSRAHLADHARRVGRRCSSICGSAEEVLDLWRLLEPAWGPAREVRDTQYLMAASGPALLPGHPDLRPLRPEELDLLFPAAIAMSTEEVGVSPVSHGGGPAYRARLAQLIESGRALGIVEQGRIVFKADIGSVAGPTCQIQGVWVAPDRRDRGLGTSGMAAALDHTRRNIAPTVSLYVNDFNHRAVAVYHRVGFERVGTFATVLF